MNAVTQRQPSEIAVVRQNLEKMDAQFLAALPAHIPVERFSRVVMTAIQNNNDLLTCTRSSLFNAAMKAAQDGLLPDGREGAMVPYKGEVTWMPMISGIRKKVRNSGEIATWDVHAVFESDQFEYELGDEPFIKHKPALGDRGNLIAVYSIATLKSGEKSRDVMSVYDVEKIRAKSRSAKGPWADPTFYPEMAKKTVARRHSKLLPMSSDLDDLIRRDDHLYDMEGAREEAQATRPRSLAGKLDQLADFSGDEKVEGQDSTNVGAKTTDQKSDAETPAASDKAAGRTVTAAEEPASRDTAGSNNTAQTRNDAPKTDRADAASETKSSDAAQDQAETNHQKAEREGRAAFRRAMSRTANPYKDDMILRYCWNAGYDGEEEAADEMSGE